MNKLNKTSEEHHLKAELYAGTVPPPALLKQFNEVDPTFAERIFKMAEAQNEHMISREKEIIRNDFISRLIGQLAMLFLILCFMAFTFVSMIVFKNTYTAIAGIVGSVFCAVIRKFPVSSK